MQRTIALVMPVIVMLSMIMTASAAVRNVPGNYSTIQSAINASVDGDTVLVQPATYFENINFRGKKIIVCSRFLLTRNVADIVATVINGSQPVSPDTASCVIMASGEDTSSILMGFTLTGGTGTLWRDIHNHNLYREGGGVLTDLTSPTIAWNIIRGNAARNQTGATSAGGGGIRCGDGNPRILNNLVADNTGYYGGGIVLNYSGGIVRNNVIFHNSGGEYDGGSGIWMYENGPAPKIIENNTVVGNASTTFGGGIFIASTSMRMKNTIVWDNTAADHPQIDDLAASMSVSYCDIQGGFVGITNINAYPMFSDSGFVLKPGSPCIDAGDPSSQHNDPNDPANPGFAMPPSRGGLRNDMGAFGGPASGWMPYIDSRLNHPMPPAPVSAVSDFHTPNSITLHWVDPAAYRNGEPLSGFKIRIYRDSGIVALVDSGTGLYTDGGLENHRLYTYSVVTAGPSDTSAAVTVSVYAGGSAVPQPPGDFRVRDGSAGVQLLWRYPSRQADNTILNDPGSIIVYRDGLQAGSLPFLPSDTGTAGSYTDTVTGYHTYYIMAADTETPVHYSASTLTSTGYGGIRDQRYRQTFDSSTGEIFKTGRWDSTSAVAHDGRFSFTDSPGGPDSTNNVSYIMMPPVVLGPYATLRFSQIGMMAFGDIGFVEISTDNRATFRTLMVTYAALHPEWQTGPADNTKWYNELVNLSGLAGDTVVIRFRLSTGQFHGDGWYIDDVSIGTFADAPTVTLHAGWNMISLPVPVADGRPSIVYPGSGKVFAWSGSRYRVVDSMAFGGGYWVHCDSSVQALLNGIQVGTDTIPVMAGWNLIGGLSLPVNAAGIVTIPPGGGISSAYIFDATYKAVTVVPPGSAFWIRVKNAGSLVLTGSGSAQTPKHSVERYATLVFRDADGRDQTIHLSERPVAAEIQRLYEAPPVPPEGVFDIRSAAQSYLICPGGEELHALVLHSAKYPLVASWDGFSESTGISLIIDQRVVRLTGSGSVRIDAPPAAIFVRMTASASMAPLQTKLGECYPNPFNPVARIGYTLAVDGGAPLAVNIKIYDILGQEVATLMDGVEGAGNYEITWNASGVASGVYYCRMTVNQENGGRIVFTDVKKLMLAK